MKFGSLFSGIGGFDHGFEQAGLSCSWQVELDGDCNRVLEKHWSGVAKYRDVRDVGQLEPVDVICGGFPCQDLSVAGQRKGLAGERSGLWFEFLRIVGLNKPRWVVIENVPGLLSSDESRDFAAILRGLVECGYCLAWRVLDAQFYGVAQRRRRVFIVGSLGDGSCAQILFESESVSWNPPTRREAGQRVTATITGGFKGAGGGNRPGMNTDQMESLIPVAVNLQVARPLANSRTTNHYDESQQTYVTHALRSEGANAGEDGTGRGTPLVVANCFNGYTGGPDDNDAQANHIVAAVAFAENQRGEVRTSDISPQLSCAGGKPESGYPAVAFGWNKSDSQTMRVDEETTDALQSSPQSNPAIAFTERTRAFGPHSECQEELAYAVTSPCQGGRTNNRQIAGNFGVRRLTPRECERLQGFPDDFTRYDASGKEISDSARYRMLGNAVAVPVSRWIGKRIVEAVENEQRTLALTVAHR